MYEYKKGERRASINEAIQVEKGKIRRKKGVSQKKEEKLDSFSKGKVSRWVIVFMRIRDRKATLDINKSKREKLCFLICLSVFRGLSNRRYKERRNENASKSVYM